MANQSICIIDDEPDLVEACSDILTREGYQVDKCTNGEQGLNLLLSRDFDLALIDLMMPRINGIQILQEVKKKNPKCAVIIFTGYPTIESAVSSLRAGAYDYLVKPFMATQLTAMVKKALEEKGSAPETKV